MFSGIRSISPNSCSLFITWVYEHYTLAVEVKYSAKGTLLSFSITGVFLYDVRYRKMTFLKRGSEVGVFVWVTLGSDCKFELQVQ